MSSLWNEEREKSCFLSWCFLRLHKSPFLPLQPAGVENSNQSVGQLFLKHLARGMPSIRVSSEAVLAARGQLLLAGGPWFWKGAAAEYLAAGRIKMIASPSADRWQEFRDAAVSLLKNTAMGSSGSLS